MTVVQEENNRTNIYAKEPIMQPVDHDYRPMIAWDTRAEQLNGRLAMMGFVIGVLTEFLTGQGIVSQVSALFTFG